MISMRDCWRGTWANIFPGIPPLCRRTLPGAGSLRAASFLYSAAPKDGSVFGTFGRTIATTPLLMPASAQFDPTRFSWLGSMTNEVSLCVTWHTSPVKDWKGSLEKPITMGGEGSGADPDVYALLYKNVFGAKWRLVSGYPGTNDTMLAMERGEVDGLCGLSWGTLRSRHLQWFNDKLVNVIVQAGLKKQPELAGVPLALDLTADPEKLQILKLFLTTPGNGAPVCCSARYPARAQGRVDLGIRASHA